MKLIREEIESAKVTITEGKDGKKRHFIEGVFLQGEIKNRNGRMYRAETLQREVAKYNEQYISKGRALGELGHPDGPTINLDRVSHLITSLQREGNNFVGKARLLDTPMGNIAKSLLDEGVKLGVSSRGLGSIKEEGGIKVVADDFMLATAADIVADPSAPDAFVNGIMEGVEWIWDAGILKAQSTVAMQEETSEPAVAVMNPEEKVAEVIEETQETINKFVDQKQLDEKKLEIFQNFLSNL